MSFKNLLKSWFGKSKNSQKGRKDIVITNYNRKRSEFISTLQNSTIKNLTPEQQRNELIKAIGISEELLTIPVYKELVSESLKLFKINTMEDIKKYTSNYNYSNVMNDFCLNDPEIEGKKRILTISVTDKIFLRVVDYKLEKTKIMAKAQSIKMTQREEVVKTRDSLYDKKTFVELHRNILEKRNNEILNKGVFSRKDNNFFEVISMQNGQCCEIPIDLRFSNCDVATLDAVEEAESEKEKYVQEIKQKMTRELGENATEKQIAKWKNKLGLEKIEKSRFKNGCYKQIGIKRKRESFLK